MLAAVTTKKKQIQLMFLSLAAQLVERLKGPSMVQLYRLTWVRAAAYELGKKIIAAPSVDIRYKYALGLGP